MSRGLLVVVVVAAVVAAVLAVPAENATEKKDGPLTAAVHIPPRPSNIVVRPPGRQVDEVDSAPVPAPGPAPGPVTLPVRTAPAPLPGTITFPNERFQTANDRLDDNQDVGSWDNLYNGCGSTKNCLGIPADCEQSRTCMAIVTVQQINTTFAFMMRARDAKWVAVGLGATEKMFDTSVVECVQDPVTEAIETHMSYTPLYPDRGCIRLGTKFDTAVTLLNSKAINGGIFCEFTRISKTRVQSKEYNLDETPYFIQMASGKNLKSDYTGVAFHGESFNAAAHARMLNSYGTLGSASNWPMRMHGALMVLAWMFAATAGSLAARYFKAAWGKATICGKAMWFAWHRFLMVLTLVLHIVAVVSALIFLEGWSTSSGIHGILGGVTTGLALLQGAAGLLRPGPDDKYRPIFNWAHRCQGFLTHILAIITIFLAVGLSSARLPNETYYLLGFYVLFYVLLHAAHSLTEVKSWYFLIVNFGSAAFAIAMLVLVVVGPGKTSS